MFRLQESCTSCAWTFSQAFHYHGGFPVEHPLCPSCGADLRWSYHKAPQDRGPITDAQIASWVALDEAGYPEDHSPRATAMNKLLDRRLEAIYGSPIRVTNIQGVADMELRPFIGSKQAQDGVKLIANVGRSQYSIALLEMLAWLGQQLPLGELIPHTSTYGTPPGVVEIFPFGTEVSLYFQHTIPHDVFETDAGQAQLQQASELVAKLAMQLRHATRAHPDMAREGRRPSLIGAQDSHDEMMPSSYGTLELERVSEGVLDQILMPEPDHEEIWARIQAYAGDLELKGAPIDEEWHFVLDSAHVRVSLLTRKNRLLVRYHSLLLSKIDPATLEGGAELAARVLITLNHETTAGRCLLEVSTDKEPTLRILFEKTLLATDLDLGEFALTLVMVAEEADRLDNLLQNSFGGLRADQTQQPHEHATDLAPLVRRLATYGLPDLVRQGVQEVRTQIRHMLEDMHLVVNEGERGDFWFSYGSARFFVHIWQDNRATFLTLRARVLDSVSSLQGLAEALNHLNHVTHFGAFSLRDDLHVELTETILADELSMEELAYALVTIGEVADVEDNRLQERFGGTLAQESA